MKTRILGIILLAFVMIWFLETNDLPNIAGWMVRLVIQFILAILGAVILFLPARFRSALGLSRLYQTVVVFITKIWKHPRVGAKTVTIVGILIAGSIILSYFTWFDSAVRKVYAGKQFRILVPLDASSREYLDFIQSGTVPIKNGKDYSSRTARNIRNIIDESKNNWFSDTQGAEYLNNRIDFYYFPEGFGDVFDRDNNSYWEAFKKAQLIANNEGKEIVGLIGNISSTTTFKYGEFCGAEGIPMILPLATATSLMNDLKVKGVTAAIRLPPTNEKQTDVISNLLLGKPENALRAPNNKITSATKLTRSIILKDLTNPLYSNDLINGFRSSYVQQPVKKYIENVRDEPNVEHIDDFGRILGIIPIGRDNPPFLYPSLNELKAQSLLIFGMTDPTLEALAQAKATKLNYGQIVLTDGAVDEYLLERIDGLVEGGNQTKIHLIFPLLCQLPKPLDLIMNGEGYKQNLEMTHGLFVADSTYLILGLLKLSSEPPGFLSMVKDKIFDHETRDKIRKKIENWRQTAEDSNSTQKIDLEFKSSDKGVKRTYSIDELGNTVNLDYHVFQIKRVKGRLKTALEWEHDPDCPIELQKKEPDYECVLSELDKQPPKNETSSNKSTKRRK